MPATLITRWRSISPTGTGVELVVWRLPEPLPPTTHGYKYRLVYVVDGKRVMGFDNERGKGDHCQIGNRELPYRFTTVDRLIDDFFREVERWDQQKRQDDD